MVKFNPVYFLATIVLFIIEVLIAVYMHDDLIRPYGGDFLVVILIYCFVKCFLNTPVITTAACVLIFAYGVEILQYFHFVKLIGLQHSKMAIILMGNQFSWIDMIAYTLGIFTIAIVEYSNHNVLSINKLS